jgi:hypothetical protein
VISDKDKIEKFREEYSEEMLKKEGVFSKIVYLGTTKGPYWEAGKLKEWKAGESDLDIKVYGNGIIPVRWKIEGVLLIKELNDKLDLRLENVPLEHWTPFYIDDSLCAPPLLPISRRALDQLAMEEIGRKFTEVIRGYNKQIIEKFGPLVTHKDLWALVKWEQALPPPILCKILL